MLQQRFEKLKDSVQNSISSFQQAVNINCSVPSFIPSTLDLQKSIKCGWLKRSGGVLKVWSRKWFVLKGDYLLFYSSEETDKQPLGFVFMPGSNIIEIEGKSNDPEKYILEIWQDCAPQAGKQIIVERLAAESLEKRNEWLKVFKELLYGSIGGAIFGKDLDSLLKYERMKKSDRQVPEIVEACVCFLEENGLEEEGVFRLPGRKSTVSRYVEQFDKGMRPALEVRDGVHSIASLLKFYLIQLPYSLVPLTIYDQVINLTLNEVQEDSQMGMEKLRNILRNIPSNNYTLLKYLCEFLTKVATNSDKNKMNISNLSVIFCNIFIRPSNTCLNLLMATSAIRSKVTHLLIANQAWLFNMELTPFGGRVIVEDLLGLEDADMNEIYMNHSVLCESIDYKNEFKEKSGKDAFVNSLNNNFKNSFEVRKSTLNDLMGLDFCTFDSLSIEESFKEDVATKDTENENFENTVIFRNKNSKKNVKRMASIFESQIDIKPPSQLCTKDNDQNSIKFNNEITLMDDSRKIESIEEVSRKDYTKERSVVLRPRGTKKYSRNEMLDPKIQDDLSNIFSMFEGR